MSTPNPLILFGSQTGTAEEIAKQIYERGSGRGLTLEISEMDAFTTKAVSRFSKPATIIFVLSSTGDGDPPDNATRFFGRIRRLIREQQKKKDEPLPFINCKFTILGLGDSNYSTFQGAPKKLHTSMTSLGASYFYPRGIIDEVHGIEEQTEVWIDGLWESLERTIIEQQEVNNAEKIEGETSAESSVSKPTVAKKKFQRKGAAVPTVRFNFIPNESSDKNSIKEIKYWGYERHDNSFQLELSNARWLTSSDSIKQNIELTFSLPEEFPTYRAGDSIGFFCPNFQDTVDRVIQRLSGISDAKELLDCKILDEATFPSHLKGCFPISVEQLLTWYCDMTSIPKKSFLKVLALYCNDEEEKKKLNHLSSMKGKEDFQREIEAERPSLADLLDMFPSCNPPADHIISCLPPLAPRYYSYSCAPIGENKRKAKVVYSILSITTPSGKQRFGLCTHWFTNLAIASGLLEAEGHYNEIGLFSNLPNKNESVYAFGFQNPSTKFHLPDVSELFSKPRIMIGPGTGVAPFIGFLEELHHLEEEIEKGDTWLFFGCRHPDKDFLYKKELEYFNESNILTRLVTAFSRETSNVVYVQDKLREHANTIGELLLEKDAYVYICGDAKGMAKSVTAELTKIIQQKQQGTENEATQTFVEFIQKDRILMDVWF